MNKNEFIKLLDGKLKLIRTEYGLTQDKMASVLGISKKTLVEIEKNRKSLGWTSSVALASIFSDSTILHDAIGGDISDLIIAVGLRDVDVDYPKTWGGKVWWKTITEMKGYRVQQNIFSRHYRLLEPENRRIYTSFSLKETEAVMEEIMNY
ncbi:MAG: helix-turn-helix domain-containing protein [Tissierellia bacterium]|nr:helix-turn-helix domain-containing protein [Tissierellia bacterium]